MSDTNKIVGGSREWWITQTLVSYAIGHPVYRVSDEKPDEHDCRMAAAIYRVVEYSAYNELVDTHVNMRRILNAELKAEREKLATLVEALEIYANRSAWVKKQNDLDPTFSRSDNEYDKSLGFYFGGKTAREALAKIKDSK